MNALVYNTVFEIKIKILVTLVTLKVSFFPFNALFEKVQIIENLSNQSSNSSTNFGLGIKQPEF